MQSYEHVGNRIHSQRGACALLLFVLSALLLQVSPLRAEENPGTTPQKSVKVTQGTSLFEKVLALNLVQEPELDVKAVRAAYAELTAKARAALKNAHTPRQKIAALNKTLLTGRKVSYLSNLYWRDATLAASLLRKRGNCMSTSTLYVVMGDTLGLPIHLVQVPSHVFVRWDGNGAQINIETTNGGRERPTWSYFARKGRNTLDRIMLREGYSLSRDEFLAQLNLIIASHKIGQNRYKEALKLYEHALKLAPYRTDLILTRISLAADISDDREACKRSLKKLLRQELPPSVATGALTSLAREYSGAGDYKTARKFLLKAARSAGDKEALVNVLAQLAFLHRATKEFRTAARYMEVVAAVEVDPPHPSGGARDPADASVLYNLSILQKNDDRLGDALASIAEGLEINPESWNLRVIQAGYHILNGQREKGMKLFKAIPKPRADEQFWQVMQAWFFAVAGEKTRFYKEFTKALEIAKGPDILDWITEDVDLDPYRKEERFKALLEQHSKRLLGKKEPVPAK